MMQQSSVRLWLSATFWLIGVASAAAQTTPAPSSDDAPIAPERRIDNPEGDSGAPAVAAPETLPDDLDADVQRSGSTAIGGGPEAPLGYKYTSPLKQFGINLGMGVYGVNLFVGLAYLAFVYPIQSIVGSSTPEPILLWNMLPLIGPVLAAFVEDSVKDKIVWQAILIGDASLQAAGLLIGLLGAALSGRRSEPPEHATGFDVQLGVAGNGGTGLTLRFRTL
ncbi:MAG: hypothetical protein ABW321_02110 [Polyangiales bacterium]